ncbi:MAG: thioredoxin family protein [Bacilli bacterium]|nr:thioredoxin family protein [Bacilli bacterium]
MNKKLKGWIFGVIVILILMIPIFSDYYKNKDIEIISYNNYLELMNSPDFAIVYFGDSDQANYNNVKESLLTARNDFTINVKTLNNNSLSDEEKTELSASFEYDNGYIFIKDYEVVYTHEGDLTDNKLEVLIDKYLNNIIPEDEISYKVAKDYAAYKKIIDGKKVIMTVLGRDTCPACNYYKPIYNDVAGENEINIYYFDSDSYDKTEYNKLLNSGLKIPKDCNESGKDVALSELNAVPLTIFTKKGKVIDCINGVESKEGLIAKLKDVGMIK